MKLEILKDVKIEGSEYTKGQVIDTSEEEISEGTANSIITKGYAKEKYPEVEPIGEDAIVQSFTEWWDDIYSSLAEENDLSEELLVNATNKILHEVGKSKRQESINQGQQRGAGESKAQSNDTPASEKQIGYLESLQQNPNVDVSIPDNPSKSEASDLIEKALKQKPATKGQKEQMDKMKISYPSDISHFEASRRIEDRMGD